MTEIEKIIQFAKDRRYIETKDIKIERHKTIVGAYNELVLAHDIALFYGLSDARIYAIIKKYKDK